jgi:hypothetical protein
VAGGNPVSLPRTPLAHRPAGERDRASRPRRRVDRAMTGPVIPLVRWHRRCGPSGRATGTSRRQDPDRRRAQAAPPRSACPLQAPPHARPCAPGPASASPPKPAGASVPPRMSRSPTGACRAAPRGEGAEGDRSAEAARPRRRSTSPASATRGRAALRLRLPAKRLVGRGKGYGARARLRRVVGEERDHLLRPAAVRNLPLAASPKEIEPRPVGIAGKKIDNFVEIPAAGAEPVPFDDVAPERTRPPAFGDRCVPVSRPHGVHRRAESTRGEWRRLPAGPRPRPPRRPQTESRIRRTARIMGGTYRAARRAQHTNLAIPRRPATTPAHWRPVESGFATQPEERPMFRGSFPALVTPFKNGKVDIEALRTSSSGTSPRGARDSCRSGRPARARRCPTRSTRRSSR